MNLDLSKFKTRWDGLAKRERWAVGVAVVLLALATLDAALLTPLLKMEQVRGVLLAAKRAELGLAIRQRQDLTAEIDARRSSADASAKTVESSFAKLFDKGVLWRADTANEWFKAIVEKHGKSLSSVAIASEGVSAGSYPGLYNHAIYLAGEMEWSELDAFMKQLGALPALRPQEILISSVDERTRGVSLSMRADILSDEKTWASAQQWLGVAKGGK